MEKDRRFAFKLDQFEKVLIGFEAAMVEDTSMLDATMKDLFMNGQVQKFKYCIELGWKTAKLFVDFVHGTGSASPKMVIKDLYRFDHISESVYKVSIKMIDARNQLSHVYNEDIFKETHKQLPTFLKALKGLHHSLKDAFKKIDEA